MRTERFTTDGPPELSIRVPSGEIHVTTVDGNETTIDFEPLNDLGRQAIEVAEVEQRGNRIVAELEERRRFLIFRDAKVGVRARCPHGTRLEVKTVAADVEADGRYGEAEVTSVSADVRVAAVEGDARLKTVSGDARVDSVGRSLKLQSVSGDIHADVVGGPAELKSVSGDARLGAASDSVTIQTVSGDQNVGAVSQGAVQAKSVSGDVSVGIARGSRVWIDAKSVSGDTRSEFDLSSSPDEGHEGDDGPLVEVRATALSGDILVMRA